MPTGPLNPNAVSKFVGDLFFRTAGSSNSFTDFGAIRGLMHSVDSSGNRIEINSDNRGTVLSGFTPEITVEVEVLENKSRDLLYAVLGGTSTDIAGSLTTVTDKLLKSSGYSWASGEVIYIDGINQTISITNVKNNGSAITVDTQYKLVKDPTGNKVGIMNSSASPISITGTGLTTTFTHTPSSAKELAITRAFQSDKTLEVKIQAGDGTGKYFTINLSSAVMDGKYDISLSDPTNGGDLKGATLTFKLQRGAVCTFHDEIL